MDHPGSSRNHAAERGTVEYLLGQAGIFDSTHPNLTDERPRTHLHQLVTRSRPLQGFFRRPRVSPLARPRGKRAEPAAETARLPGEKVPITPEREGPDGIRRRRCCAPGVHGALSE